MTKTERGSFGTKIGVILATAGSAVGLGNIWRFPYLTGKDGGAAFILIYALFVFALGIPGMICEFVVGRHGGSNAARAYFKLSGGKAWWIVGAMGMLTSTIILGFYAVVAGWCLQYLYASIAGQLMGDEQYVMTYFQEFSTNPVKPVICTLAFLLLTHSVVVHGVRNGIEKVSNLLMPTLFVLLIVIAVASCLLPGADAGIKFLFHPDFSKINKDTLLDALGQAFFSLSLGTSCLCTYASYFSRQTNLAKSAVQIAVIDTCIAILAGLMIFPAAFSVGVSPDSGPSLVFITLPNVFNQAFASMPVVGYVMSLLFYALLALASLTSTISMHEIGTSLLYEELHITRKSGAWIQTGVCAVIGVLCTLSCGAVNWLSFAGKSFLDWCDYVTGQMLMPVGAMLACLFIGWFAPRKIVHDEFTNHGTLRSTFYAIFLFCVRFICPVCIVIIFLHQFGII